MKKITFTKQKAIRGGTQITWNLDLDGQPAGLIWTFRNTPTCRFRYHAKMLSGAYADFATFDQARAFAIASG